jgi:hypothetical protein
MFYAIKAPNGYHRPVWLPSVTQGFKDVLVPESMRGRGHLSHADCQTRCDQLNDWEEMGIKLFRADAAAPHAWSATFDGYEPGDPAGSGATEGDAVADLLEQAEERNLSTDQPRRKPL